KLDLQLGLAGTVAQRHTQHVDVIGIENEQVAEILAGAEPLEENFQGAEPAIHELGQFRRSGRVGKKTLQVVEGHVRVRTAWQKPAQRLAQVAQGFGANRLGNMNKIGPAAFVITQVPGVEKRTSGFERIQTVAELFELHYLLPNEFS